MPFTLDPQVAQTLVPFAAAMADSTPPPVGDVAARRIAFEGRIGQANTAQPFPDDVTITDHELATADGATIRLRWYARKDAADGPGPAALYLHAGGMILGHIGLFDGSVSRYVSASGTSMLSVDYRLAPEHPHPTPDTPASAAPARVADPAGLPPAYIEVGQLDIFRDEDLAYALRLSQAGVPVEFHLHPGVPHRFETVAFTSDVAQRVIADRVRALASL
ncbi:alpha/beta hydrolase [Nocardia nepalensis]|uniref:alpha/beta hydrolase n=1 Tax=Nocardia nepalensis TaxID=3375448 RepID=UPI003B66FB95